jgi:hypothetical protein
MCGVFLAEKFAHKSRHNILFLCNIIIYEAKREEEEKFVSTFKPEFYLFWGWNNMFDNSFYASHLFAYYNDV